jgi:hypothetical protein
MPQIAIFRIENRQLLLHFHLHRYRRDIGWLQLAGTAMNNHGISAEGNIGFTLILLLNPALQIFLPLCLTVDDKDFRRLGILRKKCFILLVRT